MEIFAKNYGVLPDKEVGKELTALLHELSQTDEPKELVFAPGTYHIDTKNCDEKMLFITNTVGDNEFSDGETPHLNKIGLNFQNIKNLTVLGNGAEFIIDGRATNVAIENCANITINDIAIDVDNPDMHELVVEKVSAFSVIFRLDDISTYKPYKNRFAFTGNGYNSDFFENRVKAFWCGRIVPSEPDNIQRVRHPFVSAIKVQELSDHLFKATYPKTSRFNVGERYYIYKARRQFAGIFVNASKDITFNGIRQYFNYSLALVCQDTENITLTHSDFSPRFADKRLMASCADFVQICMCKGKVNITDNNFCGAGDDTLNVHGMHLAVKDIKENELTVRFMHPQAHGYNAFHKGDEIEFVNPSTLLPHGKTVVLASKMVDEYNIVLTVESTVGVTTADAVENITMCPDLLFQNNTLNRIITRNLLITTRGKVEILNNNFINSTMASILIADDAKNWYESGPVHDVLISKNNFGECRAEFVCVMPENGKNKLPVHKNIKITDNIFNATKDKGLRFKCTENVTIKDNTIKSSAAKDNFVSTLNCKNISSDI